MTQETIQKEIEKAVWSVNYHKKELAKAEILLDGLSRKIATFGTCKMCEEMYIEHAADSMINIEKDVHSPEQY